MNPAKRADVKEKLRQKRLYQVFPVKDTSIEIKLQNAFKERGIVFETHKHIIGQPDIFIPPNICIFCDGDYWHSRKSAIERDKMVSASLRNKGYIVLRFREHQINSDVNNCIRETEEKISNACGDGAVALSQKQEAHPLQGW